MGAVTDWRVLRPEVTDELLGGIVRRIVRHFHPEKVILFGSYAWGAPHGESDLDLFVVMESDEPLFTRIRRVREVAETPYLPMDIIVRTPDEVEERIRMGDHFVARVLEKGVVLYDASGGVGRQGRRGLRGRRRSEPEAAKAAA